MTRRPSQRKYRNEPTTIDGITFASKREARRYHELKLLERAGEIRDLCLQPQYQIELGGIKICKYVADFGYHNIHTNQSVVEDVKGVKTAVYRLKKKLVQAFHGIEIQEV